MLHGGCWTFDGWLITPMLVPRFTNAHAGLAFALNALLLTVLLFSLRYLRGHNPVNPRAFVSRGRMSRLPPLTPMQSFMRLQRQIAASFARVPPPCYSRCFFQSLLFVRCSVFVFQTKSFRGDHPCPPNSIPQQGYAKDWWKMFAHVWSYSQWFDECFRLMIVWKELKLFFPIFDRKFLLFIDYMIVFKLKFNNLNLINKFFKIL